MRLFNTISELDEISSAGLGVVIGNFDGVHVGHQTLIRNFIKQCDSISIQPLLVTFNPHPALFLNPSLGAFLISSNEEKFSQLSNLGIDNFLELHFNEDIQQLSAQEFIESFLLAIPNVKLFYLGHDFSLGQGKEPAETILKKAIQDKAIEVFESESVEINSMIVSSSLIREKIKEGDISVVNQLLGRNYFLREKVTNGYGVGRKELVPTANIQIHPDQLHPKSGVYFTYTIYQNKKYHSITNIGFRPSLQDDSGLSIETNIFDFDENIYDETITIEFIKFHRDEIKFASKEALLNQINLDIEARKNFHD